MIPSITIEATFTDVDYELIALMAGLSLLELIHTPQNRDTWRRATLTKADA